MLWDFGLLLVEPELLFCLEEEEEGELLCEGCRVLLGELGWLVLCEVVVVAGVVVVE